MTLPNLNALEAEWAVFMENKTGNRNGWTQDQRWRSDNPGEFAKLVAYRDAGGERPVLTSEPGRRMVFHVDAYLLAKEQVEPEPEPTLPLDWVHDYTAARGQATPAAYGWNWGVQYGGTISPGGAANTLALIPDGIKPGMPSARFTVAPDAGNDAVEGLYKWPVKLGEHKFYGQMVKFPTDWQEPSPAKWGACLNQFGYQAHTNATQSMVAHADNCMYVLLTGEQRWPDPSKPGIGSPIREYDNTLGEWPVYPTVIKPPMRLGVWHQLIFEIKWSTCSSRSANYAAIGSIAGHIRVWHKHKGDTTWTETYEQLDIPTLQWGYGYDWDGSGTNKPVFWPVNSNGFTASHKFGLYAGGASFPRVVEHGNICQGASFESVAKQLG